MIYIIKNYKWVIATSLICIIFGLLTFFTFTNQSFITLRDLNLQILLIIDSILLLLFLTQISLADTVFEKLKESRKTSYLDFILLKIEQRLIQRHGLLGTQTMALRVQYQSILSQVDFSEEDSKIIISVIGVMDKKRYKNKKYKPKIADCNVLRNILLYGKYGYNIFQKRNKYLTNAHMKEILDAGFKKVQTVFASSNHLNRDEKTSMKFISKWVFKNMQLVRERKFLFSKMNQTIAME